MFMGILIFFSGLLSVFLVRKHFFLSVLSLEFLILSNFFFSYFFLEFYLYDFYFSILVLVLGVCEGVLGLSLIVYIYRKFSVDYLDSLNLI
nr:NADH dehydrogenase subunit 4L [Eusarima sp.]